MHCDADRNALLTKTYLAWAGMAASAREERNKASRQALALMSGKAELLLQVALETCTRQHAHAHEHTNAHMHTRTHTRTLTNTNTYTRTNAPTNTPARRVVFETGTSACASSTRQVAFENWCAEVRSTIERRAELAAKFRGRYLNAALAKTYLAWAGLAATAAAERQAQMARAAAFLSGRDQLMLRVYFEAFQRAVHATAEAREAAVRAALGRMRNGLLASAFAAWVDWRAERAAEGAAAAEPGVFRESAAVLLQTTQTLSVALEELRRAREANSSSEARPRLAPRCAPGSRSVPESPRASHPSLHTPPFTSHPAAGEHLALHPPARGHAGACTLPHTPLRSRQETAVRLSTIEAQLSTTSRQLARSEQLLAPLPAAAVDQAAYAMMRQEVGRPLAHVPASRPPPWLPCFHARPMPPACVPRASYRVPRAPCLVPRAWDRLVVWTPVHMPRATCPVPHTLPCA